MSLERPQSWTLRERVAELHPRPWLAWAGFIAIGLSLTALHVYRNAANMAGKEIWLDEASTWAIASYPLDRLIVLAPEYHSQPPFFYAVLHYWRVFGNNELALRSLSWWCMALLLFFVLFSWNELKLHARFVFGFLFVANDYTKWLSQELRPYAMAALLTMVSSVLLLRAAREPRRLRGVILYFVSALMMAYTLAFNAWIVGAHGIFGVFVFGDLLWRRGLRATFSELRFLMPALILVGALYLPYVRFVSASEAALLPEATYVPFEEHLDEALRPEHVTQALEGFLGFKGASLLALALVALAGCALERKLSVVLWLLLFFGQIAFVHGFTLGKLPPAQRYMTPAFPIIFVGVALAVHHLQRRRIARGITIWILILAPLVYFARVEFLEPPAMGDNWRKLYARMARYRGKKVIFFRTGFYGQMLGYVARKDRNLSFYTDGYELPPGLQIPAGGKQMTEAYVRAAIEERAATTVCFFYSLDYRYRGSKPVKDPVFEGTFIPMMKERGYKKKFELDSGRVIDFGHDGYQVHGYCKK